MFQTDSGRTACVRPLRHSSVAPGMQKAKAPTNSLSELNSKAFGFAVYASWSELPQYHAKLASSCWSGSTARDSHPQGSDEKFQSCNLHLIPLVCSISVIPQCSKTWQIGALWSREELFPYPCGLTTWERFLPPTFGVRNWYILRLDRLSQGLPRPKMTGGVSWLRIYGVPVVIRRL
jgi:hypothetical protein